MKEESESLLELQQSLDEVLKEIEKEFNVRVVVYFRRLGCQTEDVRGDFMKVIHELKMNRADNNRWIFLAVAATSSQTRGALCEIKSEARIEISPAYADLLRRSNVTFQSIEKTLAWTFGESRLFDLNKVLVDKEKSVIHALVDVFGIIREERLVAVVKSATPIRKPANTFIVLVIVIICFSILGWIVVKNILKFLRRDSRRE